MFHPPRITGRWAVTLLELLIVLVIISILASVATGVYTGETRRARIVATRDLIRQLELSIAQYEIDLGLLPPSGSGEDLPPTALAIDPNRSDGSGYLFVSLVHSVSGNSLAPASALWKNPYITFQAEQLAPLGTDTSGAAPMINILDSWGNPIRYVVSTDYSVNNGNFSGGTAVFSATAPDGANPDLPSPNPFLAFGETFYNPRTFQIISFGPDGQSLEFFPGAADDDITNFGF
jgi:prepilin-type N-terminal cleavage/methylation domain-containing protein